MVRAFTFICAAFAVTAAIDENNVNEKRCKGWTAGWEHAFDRQSIKPTSLDGDGGACSTQWSHEIHSASCMTDHTVVLGKGFVNPYVKVLSCLPELALELGAPAPRSCRDVHAVYHEAGCCGDAEASTDVIF